jgi:DNA-binding LacI/PurR family transcriptional regulator
LAGVSAGTVSRVVNGRDGVGSNTRERVLTLIDEKGYRASFFAQNLAGQRAQAIGVVFPLLASELVIHPVFPELLGAVGDAASEAGYSLSLVTAPERDRNDHVLEEVSRGRLDGVLLPDVRAGDDLLDQLAEREFPTVVVGHRAEQVAWVDCDHDQASFELTTLLIETGHDQIAFLNGPPELMACQLRHAGYRRALETAGLPMRTELEREGTFSAKHGFDALSELLEQTNRDRPTAVVAASDLIAAGAYQAARAQRLRVPEDVAITGFDDQPVAAHLQPPLTTVRMPLAEMGRFATEVLLRLIDGEDVRPRSLVLPTEIVLRESSGTGARWIF